MKIRLLGVLLACVFTSLACKRDRTAPSIELISPAGTSTTDDRPAFRVRLVDESAIKPASVKMVLDGAALEVSVQGHMVTAQAPNALADGPHQLAVSAADQARNKAAATFDFNVSPVAVSLACIPQDATAPTRVRLAVRTNARVGAIRKLEWDFDGDGSVDSSEDVELDHYQDVRKAGRFEAAVKVSDHQGKTADARCAFEVKPSMPEVTASVDRTNGPAPLSVYAACSARDEDGEVAAIYWDYGNGRFRKSDNGRETHVFKKPGTYALRCKAVDDDGNETIYSAPHLEVRATKDGAPSAKLWSRLWEGPSPLEASFGVNASGDIARVVWDFDGDGEEDTPTDPEKPTYEFTHPGEFFPTVTVETSTGATARDVGHVIVRAKPTLTVSDPVVGGGRVAKVSWSLNVSTSAAVLIIDAHDEVVRTLWKADSGMGDHEASWDGRGDAGQPVADGIYYPVLEYAVADETTRYDPRAGSELERFTPERQKFCEECPFVFNSQGELLNIRFAIPAERGVSEVTAFIGENVSDTRLITLANRVPYGPGDHVIYWDGRLEDGTVPRAPNEEGFLVGLFAYELPKGAILVNHAPKITDIVVVPQRFDPLPAGHADPHTSVGFRLSEAAHVELDVVSVNSGALVASVAQNLESGNQALYWDGRDQEGQLVTSGDYRLVLRASDPSGNTSLANYTLVQIAY